ncbi:MAG: hypothetical protein I4O49_21995 [Janthinobacterium lividum]|nr:hypothetical protein [Janthinobacterium lividum]
MHTNRVRAALRQRPPCCALAGLDDSKTGAHATITQVLAIYATMQYGDANPDK